MTGAGLRIEELGVSYAAAEAVRAVSLTVAPGEVVALLGPNGAGKSSLLRAAMGLVPAAGRILLDGRPLHDLPAERRARLGLAFVPEGRRVFAGMSVADNLLVAADAPLAERRRRLQAVHGLFPQLAERPDIEAWRLSGGQQQMLAIGRALMAAPRVLLLDEPSLGLAPILVADVLSRVRAIADEGAAVLLAEQNAAAALRHADRAVLLRLGRVALAGTAAEVQADPQFREVMLGG